MKTQNFFVKMKSDALAPILNALIIELENRFEELLIREVVFVKQCYRNGSKLWWRKFFNVGVKMPSDSELRQWIVSQTHPPFWLCFNPKVMVSAHEHFKMKSNSIKIDLKYAKELVLECDYKDNINIWTKFTNRHPVFKSIVTM